MFYDSILRIYDSILRVYNSILRVYDSISHVYNSILRVSEPQIRIFATLTLSKNACVGPLTYALPSVNHAEYLIVREI